jgi:PKD repeat protein/Tol biopolymer transport system component
MRAQVFPGAAFVVILATLLAYGPAAAAGVITERVSVASDGTQGDNHSAYPSISADGRYVAFWSNASNLVGSDTNDEGDVFTYDRQTGQTTRVSIASDGTQGDDSSYEPSISADGRYVAFKSDASNLVTDDTNNAQDVFVNDRQTGQTTRVSVASDGAQANSLSYWPSISANGRYVAFTSLANNLVSGDTNNADDIFVHDRQTGQTTPVSVASDGTQGNARSIMPSISADGRYVAFFSDASNLVSGDTNDYMDVFVHDRQTGQTSRVSVASDGTQGNNGSFAPSISADGRYVAFFSDASNLVSGDTNDYMDVFVHDRQTGQTSRVSVASDGTQGNSISFDPSISADGRYIAFTSVASNLVSDDSNGDWDIFVHDQQTGQTSRVSVASDGTQMEIPSPLPSIEARPSISADGCCVAFGSNATNLVSDDTNGVWDVFTAHDLPTAYFYADPTVGVPPLTVTFTNTSRCSDSYVWDYGDGLTGTGTTLTHTHAYTSAGVYTVSLTASSPYGSDVLTYTDYIGVYDIPIASFSGSPLVGTAPLQVEFNNHSLDATSYHWDFGDGSDSTAANPTHDYFSSGTYTVTLTASNPVGSDVLTRPAYITVHQPPVPDFIGEPTTGLSPVTVTYTNTSQYADSYVWDYGDGQTSTTGAVTHTHSYPTVGAYTVTLTAVNVHAAVSNTRVAYVNVYTTPVPAFDATPIVGAVPLTVTFSNSSTGASDYSWSFGNGETSPVPEPVHVYNAPGHYTVTLTAFNPVTSASLTKTHYITAYLRPVADFTATPRLGTSPLVITITNLSQNADTFLWHYGDGITSTVATIVHSHTYSVPGVYTVSLTSSNSYNYDVKTYSGYVVVYNPLLDEEVFLPIIMRE